MLIISGVVKKIHTKCLKKKRKRMNKKNKHKNRTAWLVVDDDDFLLQVCQKWPETSERIA